MDRLEQRIDKMALRSELVELKARVDGLQEQVRMLEGRLELSSRRSPLTRRPFAARPTTDTRTGPRPSGAADSQAALALTPRRPGSTLSSQIPPRPGRHRFDLTQLRNAEGTWQARSPRFQTACHNRGGHRPGAEPRGHPRGLGRRPTRQRRPADLRRGGGLRERPRAPARRLRAQRLAPRRAPGSRRAQRSRGAPPIEEGATRNEIQTLLPEGACDVPGTVRLSVGWRRHDHERKAGSDGDVQHFRVLDLTLSARGEPGEPGPSRRKRRARTARPVDPAALAALQAQIDALFALASPVISSCSAAFIRSLARSA